MKKATLFPVLLFLLIFQSCDKEAEVKEKDYPYLITTEISDLTNTSVVFNGKIISTGNEEIIEYGFLWDTYEPKIETANKIVMSNSANIGSYSAKTSSSLIKDSQQLVRAYLKTSSHLVYGNTIKFTSNGGASGEITDITPLRGYVNSKVIIEGNNFSYRKDEITVFFGDVKAEIDSCTDKKLIVRVPDIDEDAEVVIKVVVNNKTITANSKYTAFTYWKKIANFPGASRYGATSFSINNKGYVGLGKQYFSDCYSDFYEYSPQINGWKKIKDFPGGARRGAIGFSFNGKGYVGFGYTSNNEYHDLWEYDPSTDNWSKIIENENIRTYEDAYFLIEEELFILTQNSFYKLNLENMEFSDLGYFDYRYMAAGFSSGSKGYMFAGKSYTEYLKDLWEYNSSENSWKKLSELAGSQYRDAPIGFSLGERLFMGMGRNVNAYKDIFEYKTNTGEWFKLENLPGEGRAFATSFIINDKAYIGTGFDDYINQFSNFYGFNPTKE